MSAGFCVANGTEHGEDLRILCVHGAQKIFELVVGARASRANDLCGKRELAADEILAGAFPLGAAKKHVKTKREVHHGASCNLSFCIRNMSSCVSSYSISPGLVPIKRQLISFEISEFIDAMSFCAVDCECHRSTILMQFPNLWGHGDSAQFEQH